MKTSFAAFTLVTVSAMTPKADLTPVNNTLKSLRTGMEVYFTDHNRYPPDLSLARYTVADGVAVKFLESGAMSYSVVGTLAGAEGVSCVMKVGAVSKLPQTAKGKPAESEGAIVCDD
jgi:hypothetical protein